MFVSDCKIGFQVNCVTSHQMLIDGGWQEASSSLYMKVTPAPSTWGRRRNLLNQYLPRIITSFLSRNSKCRFSYLICLHDTMPHQMSVHQNMRIADSLAGTTKPVDWSYFILFKIIYFNEASHVLSWLYHHENESFFKLQVPNIIGIYCFLFCEFALFSYSIQAKVFKTSIVLTYCMSISLYSNLPCLYTLVINVCPSFYTCLVRISQHHL